MKRQTIRAVVTMFVIVFGVSVAFGQKTQKFTVRVGTSYRPSSLKLKKGIPARLTFIRTSDETCGQQIVLPAYGITRDLPLNQPVAVTFTPKRTGTFSFTCGMRMMRGKIIVN
jgi:plastocyanin domain-containing protein